MATGKKARVVRLLFCDFCGGSQETCHVLIQGRDQVHICEACVGRCVEIVIEHNRRNAPSVEEPPAADAVDPHA